MRHLFPAVLGLALLAGTPALAWEEPAHWADIGTVQQWMDLDARFYRTFDDNRFVDRSQFRLEQESIYAETVPYGGELPAISLADFLQLSADRQQQRIELARGKLAYVERFLNRARTQAQRARENLPSGWGDNISDVTVLGDCLINLSDAVGLDPSNPHAWHLQAYFAMCAGDLERSRRYLQGAFEALSYVPADALIEIKQRVALDLAWNLRDTGDFAAAQKKVDLADELAGPGVESLLLRGLICARTGRPNDAGRIAAQLRSVEIRRFPSDQRATDFKPELLDPSSWVQVPSNYLAAWITALSLLSDGEKEAALATFGNYSANHMYPFGWRFWNEAGLIYEMTGRSAQALEAWNTARINRPWLRFMVYRPYDLALGILTGNDARTPYMLAYDRFFMAGSRLAYGASLVGRVGNAESPQDKQEWALRALDQLEICQRTGVYPGQASVLQGHAYYLLGDTESSVRELEEAIGLLEKQGDDQVQQAVMKDLAAITQNQQASDMKGFLKQSGSSRGRWAPEADPEAREKELLARVRNDPEDRAAAFELARFLIRHGRPGEGRDLVIRQEGYGDSVEAVTLLLEADRLLGDADLALDLVKRLDSGKAGAFADAGLWSLVGSLCLEQGRQQEARRALNHALELDPENQGLRMQLRLMGD